MSTTLDQIMAHTLLQVHAKKETANLARLERRAAEHLPRGFAGNLRKAAAAGPAVIAELKKASPSRGVIREHYSPVDIARGYAAAGAAAISVLTDEEFFKGSLDDLEAVSKVVSIPVLRKDFILDPFQILEARAAGADAILLIVAAHNDETLKMLADEARSMQLDVLCEVHDKEEIERAKDLGLELIGVNSRNLKTMVVTIESHLELLQYLPANAIRVAESGIRTPDDVEKLVTAGYDAFLIGEALMRQPDPAATLALLTGSDYAAEI